MNQQNTTKPMVVIVRDGWGHNPNPEHDAYNAVKLANTPVCDALLTQYPWTLIGTSSQAVGLPDGTMGNSEVGHQNIGAGRIVNQESVRISNAIAQGSFYQNKALIHAIEKAKQAGRYVHLLGIASDAGVHGLLKHLYACIGLCQQLGQTQVALHLFTDGRDTGPYTGKDFLAEIQDHCNNMRLGTIASLCGRYYAMDRDNRWQRVQQAYDLLTGRCQNTPHFSDVGQAIQDYYDHPSGENQKGDEFVLPRTIGANPDQTRIADGDTVIFYNYRGDRPREIVKAFTLDNAQWADVPPSPDTQERGFDRGPRLDLQFVTMTAYQVGLPVQVAFTKPPKMPNIMGSYLQQLGKKQFRCAETEKFPHVTFFFNDYREEPFQDETRQMAQSPSVATYDLQPQMSAAAITQLTLDNLAQNDFILVNFANGDMVGHTGNLQAAIEAIETVDACVGKIVQATLKLGGKLIVTADHGNAEQMFDPNTGSAHTAHTLFDVQCIVVDPVYESLASKNPTLPSEHMIRNGKLADVIPTALELMALPKPQEMTAQSLLKSKP